MEERLGEIYIITNVTNSKQYIGQAVCYTGNKDRFLKHGAIGRWKQHLYNALNYRCDATLLDRAIRKYGKDNFKVETILTCTLDKIDQEEINAIVQYNTRHPNGYNLRTGGNHGGKHHDSTKLKIGNAHRDKCVSTETRIKIGKSSRGRNISDENKNSIKNALEQLGMKEMPMYIGLNIDRRNNRNVQYITVTIPNEKRKKFAKKNMELSEKIKLAIEYKNFILQRSSVGGDVTTPVKA
jgi:group I intron endonuclease